MVIPVNNREITGFLTFHNRENRRVQTNSTHGVNTELQILTPKRISLHG